MSRLHCSALSAAQSMSSTYMYGSTPNSFIVMAHGLSTIAANIIDSGSPCGIDASLLYGSPSEPLIVSLAFKSLWDLVYVSMICSGIPPPSLKVA